ncbi:MAG: hypothetical protein H7296_11290 [Bacteroidia bacterium]|nr:hypothetical protein [Bacteroidia bacterium]
MNYLSHFYIHQKPNDPYFNAGLILPDLGRSFVKTFKEVLINPADLNLCAISNGCLQHYEADKLFHGSEFFKWGTLICTEELKDLHFNNVVEKRWFIGHILFEMLLDRLLVRHQPQVLTDFYDQIQLADLNQIKEFFILSKVNRKEKLLQYFNHFRKVQYIRSYIDTNLFVYSLSRVLIRAGLPALTFSDRAILEECVKRMENDIFKDAYHVLLRLKKVF